MESGSELAKRFREVILNGKWIANTNYNEQLEGLPWKTATAKSNDLNTIANLTQHIHYYINGINNVFSGGTLDIRDTFSFDFPAFESQKTWDAFLSQFWKDTQKFAAFVEQMDETQLQQVFTDEKYGTYRRNIEAMIEHSYYHLGQIVLIKKIITTTN